MPTKTAAKAAAAPAKKAPAKKATAAQIEEFEGRSREFTMDPDLCAKVLALRGPEGAPIAKWSEVAEAAGVNTGSAMLAYMMATVPPREKVKGTLAERMAAAVRLREQEYSWGQIMVRTGLTQGACREAWRNSSTAKDQRDDRGHRVGRGGRFPVEIPAVNGASGMGVRAKRAAKAAAAAPAKKQVQTTGRKAFTDMTLAELKDRLEGAAIMVKRGSGTVQIKVKAVTGLTDGVVQLTDAQTGGSRAVKTADIAKAGRVISKAG
jgi:hypothetical protein